MRRMSCLSSNLRCVLRTYRDESIFPSVVSERPTIEENDLSDAWAHYPKAMSEHTIEELNQTDDGSFVEILGDVYESSPWVAEQARSERPLASVEDLHGTMESAVRNASRDEKTTLLRAHPDLGEQTEMTEASEEEQASAGLDQLSPEQYEAFQRLNEEYREKFGFPFIMAVRDESPNAIREAMEERVDHSKSEEFRTALDEVHEIAQLRLDDMLRA